MTNVNDIVAWRLCLGCGACAYICPEDKVTLSDVVNEGIRPRVEDNHCGTCTDCLDVCPAYKNDHLPLLKEPGLIRELVPSVGPVLEIWEGHATDPELRFRGASGGVMTALALFCLEREAMHGVLHVGGDPADPVRNRTRMSRSRQELLACTGSRYAPASACDGLHFIESAPAKCVFIGQPSEVTAMRKAERLRPKLHENIGLAISFFCAGSPATSGTIELLKSLHIRPDEVEEIRYRGLGWPGQFAVRKSGQTSFTPLMSYSESWGFLQRYRPYSTHLCPDGTGEDADISCGDPWYREIQPDEPGLSLVVVRTPLGRELLKRAQTAGYLALKPANAQKLITSQGGLIAKRGAIGGRIAMFRMLGLPTPRLHGFSLLRNWLRLPIGEKLRSTVGSIRRIFLRKYYRPMRLER